MFYDRYAFRRREDNLLFAVKKFVDVCKIPVSYQAIANMEKRAEYPSVATIISTFKEWSVHCSPRLLTISELQELSHPCIVHLRDGGGMFALITHVTNTSVSVIEQSGATVCALSDFEKRWDGIVVLAFTDESSGEPEFQESMRNQRHQNIRTTMAWVTLTALLAIATYRVFTNPFPVLALVALTLKITGLFSSVLLLLQAFHSAPSWVNRFCKNKSSNSCSDLAMTESSKIVGISWAEIGCIFFTGGIVSFLFLGDEPGYFVLNGFASLITSTFIFYSIYQQWKTKLWCRLCLVTMIVLAGDALAGTASIATLSNYPLTNELWLLFAGAYALMILIGLLVHQSLWEAPKAKGLERSLNDLKSNQEVFQGLTKIQRHLPPTGLKYPLRLNRNGTNTLHVITSIGCASCALAYRRILPLASQHPWLCIEIILFNSSNNNDEYATQVIAGILEAGDFGPEEFRKAFIEKTIRSRTEKSQQTAIDELAKHYAWCAEVGIEATPTYFYNGAKLPLQFTIEDLQHHLQELEPNEMVTV